MLYSKGERERGREGKRVGEDMPSRYLALAGKPVSILREPNGNAQGEGRKPCMQAQQKDHMQQVITRASLVLVQLHSCISSTIDVGC